MEEEIRDIYESEEKKDLSKLSKEELKKIFEQMTLSEIEDMINLLNEVKSND